MGVLRHETLAEALVLVKLANRVVHAICMTTRLRVQGPLRGVLKLRTRVRFPSPAHTPSPALPTDASSALVSDCQDSSSVALSFPALIPRRPHHRNHRNLEDGRFPPRPSIEPPCPTLARPSPGALTLAARASAASFSPYRPAYALERPGQVSPAGLPWPQLRPNASGEPIAILRQGRGGRLLPRRRSGRDRSLPCL